MDVSTFYALFSATCFTLVGLWWNVVQSRPVWMRDPELRRAVGGVYLAFLLPAMMGLFAQVGGTETPAIWRGSFVLVAVIGVVSTLSLLTRSRDQGTSATLSRVGTIVLYAAVAVIGAFPEIAEPLDIRPIEAEAFLLILLVAMGHAVAWRFMVENPPEEPATDDSGSNVGSHRA
jgi:hypothetical protein